MLTLVKKPLFFQKNLSKLINIAMEFNKAYNRTDFVNFVRTEFLPEDYLENIQLQNPEGVFNYSKTVTKIGECPSLALDVYEVKHNSYHDARVSLSRESFRILNQCSWNERALIAFVPKDNPSNYRISLVCIDRKWEGEKKTKEFSNPRRFSYFLGEGIGTHTPDKYLKSNGRVTDFKDLQNRFSVEVLTKAFYDELFNWYQWALSDEVGITFPNDVTISDDDRKIDEHLIRLITRLMFVWFIKEKSLVPGTLFDEKYLKTILKNFVPESSDSGNYYNAILQNLFFATLNKEIGQRAFASDDPIFAKRKEHYGIKTLYRYPNLFTISEKEVISLFSSIPFLNGGLFECLDRSNENGKVIYYDGFSRNKQMVNGKYKCIAFIPNRVFFDKEKGIIPLLKKYNFTIEENSPSDTQVALDPELLGKVFENLLGDYNPETKETARNHSGSFYTPREVVNYMVDESLINYILSKVKGVAEDDIRELFRNNEMPESIKSNPSLVKNISESLQGVRILDPACGSGAFPMGALNRIVELLKVLYEFKGTNTCSLKLHLIENCIYGSDIQNIAVQISKLRFFISLVCEQNKEEGKENFGIIPMPNLETKFVAANTLIRRKTSEPNLFDTDIRETKEKLLAVRHEHFSAKNSKKKAECRRKDKELRDKLTELLESNNYCSHEDAKQLAAWNPYDQNEPSTFFDMEWMFGFNDGFDIVIGNPPYVQLQNNRGELANLYSDCDYQTFARTGDIYCLFYERGYQLLKNGGNLCYITSNKWMRASYGEKTREFFVKKTNPKLLIDFGGVKIFESATVDTNILLFSKEDNVHKVVCAVTKKGDKNRIKELSDFVRQNHTVCSFDSSDSWVILSSIEQSIKRKIEAVGTPLKDWDIQINYGIKTGYNEAFIIDTAKRDEILANCSTLEERKRTDELIRPILRGRDIKRYGYDWANLWLINTHNGIRGKFPRININEYPAVKAHLDQYRDQICDRADQGDTPYNL